MNRNERISERDYQGRLKSLLKSAFNTQLQPLRSLETVTKKRRALKKTAAKNSGFTKSGATTSGRWRCVRPRFRRDDIDGRLTHRALAFAGLALASASPTIPLG